MRRGTFMTFDITFSKTSKKKAEALVLCVGAAKALAVGGETRYETRSFAERALEKSPSFKGKAGQTLVSLLPAKASYDRLILLGVGRRKNSTRRRQRRPGQALRRAGRAGIKGAELIVGGVADEAIAAAHLGAGAKLRSYRFEVYKSEKADDEKTPKPERLYIVTGAEREAEKIFKRESQTIKGVFLPAMW